MTKSGGLEKSIHNLSILFTEIYQLLNFSLGLSFMLYFVTCHLKYHVGELFINKLFNL